MTSRMLAPALALASLATAQTAQAQAQACVNPADLSDAVVYVMPIVFDAVGSACANRLSADGFMATRGEDYIAQFRAKQDRSWPGAFRFLKTITEKEGGNGKDDQMGEVMSSMPEEALRPFVDAMFGQKIAEEIKGENCSKIERGLELLSPLPVDNVGGLIAFVAELSDLKNPPICGAAPVTAERK